MPQEIQFATKAAIVKISPLGKTYIFAELKRK